MIVTLKRIVNFLNRIGGIDDGFLLDEIDEHIEMFGFDEPSLNR